MPEIMIPRHILNHLVNIYQSCILTSETGKEPMGCRKLAKNYEVQNMGKTVHHDVRVYCVNTPIIFVSCLNTSA